MSSRALGLAGLGVVIALVLGAGVLTVFTHDSAKQVSVQDAVDRYRQAQTPSPAGAGASPTAAPTATPTPSGPAATPGATARPVGGATQAATPGPSGSTGGTGPASRSGSGAPALPPPGVYSYDASGYEQANTPLGNERHNYAGQHPITVARSGCGEVERLDFTTQRWDSWGVCPDGTAESLRFRTTHHEFKGHSDQRTYDCGSSSHDRPASDAPGATTSAHCPSSGNSQSGAATLDYKVTVVGMQTLTIGGQAVEALHLRLDETFSGATRGTAREDRWIDPQTNLILRWTRTEDTKSTASGGGFFNVTVPYHEEYTLTLRSLRPQT